MSFPLDLVPTALACPCCETVIIEHLSKFQRFEVLVAQVLKAKLAGGVSPGVDVYASTLFPGLTFQVKFAHPNYPKTGHMVKRGNKMYQMNASPRWFWSGNAEALADWYIFFGILDNEVYSFVFPRSAWLSKACDAYLYGRRRKQLAVIAKKMSRRGKRGMVMNKMWEYEVPDWPNGLFDILQS